MNWLLDSPLLICLTISLVAFLESFALLGILVPGVVLLFSLSAIANTQGISALSVMTAGMIGAAMGDIFSFYIGRQLKDNISQWHWFKRHQNWLEQGEWFIKRWGWLSVIIGRFLGPLRPVIPLAAGTLRMPPKQFIPLSLMTVLIWAPAYLLPGYYTGELSELWQLQPLSNQAMFKYVLTTLAIAGSAVAIYHHAHPEQEHMRNWLSKNNALHWPISSVGLTTLSLLAIAAFLWFQPNTHNAEFLAWSTEWQQQGSTPIWKFFSALSFIDIVLLQIGILLSWLAINRNYPVALLLGAALALLAMLAQLSKSHLAPNQEISAFIEMTLFTYALGIGAMISSNHLHGLKRWPIYLMTSVVLILCAVSHLWLGQLSLTATGIAIFLALSVTGAVRSLWRTWHFELSAKNTHTLLLLLMLTSMATGLMALTR